MLFRTALAATDYITQLLFLFIALQLVGQFTMEVSFSIHAHFVDSLRLLLAHIIAQENSFGKANSNRSTETLDAQIKLKKYRFGCFQGKDTFSSIQ